jgi:hypothetical protein
MYLCCWTKGRPLGLRLCLRRSLVCMEAIYSTSHDGSRPARRLPYDARQALDAQERARGDGRCLVEIIAAIAERAPTVV